MALWRMGCVDVCSDERGVSVVSLRVYIWLSLSPQLMSDFTQVSARNNSATHFHPSICLEAVARHVVKITHAAPVLLILRFLRFCRDLCIRRLQGI